MRSSSLSHAGIFPEQSRFCLLLFSSDRASVDAFSYVARELRHALWTNCVVDVESGLIEIVADGGIDQIVHALTETAQAFSVPTNTHP